MAVAARPRAVLEVAPQPLEPRFDFAGRHLRERRDRAAHACGQIRMRPPPVGTQEAVDTIVGNRQRIHLDMSQRAPELLDGRADSPVDRGKLGEVVVDQPEAEVLWIPGDDHDAAPRDPAELVEPARSVGPVVHGQDGQRRREAVVAERELGCGGLTTGALPRLRCRITVIAGSTARTDQWIGSWERAPAPTLTTVSVSPSARVIAAASRGSGRRRAR